jgi:PIN domain nuclease of toxin-antitoxin system
MNLLLDTHAMLWWYENPKLLSEEARKAIENGDNDVFISAVVFWEISIKSMTGKLVVPDTIYERALTDFFELPISSNHARMITNLEPIHTDPFDRLLLSQAKSENLVLVTRDSLVLKYSDIKFLVA